MPKSTLRLVLETVFSKCPNTIVLLETADGKNFARITYDNKARIIRCESAHNKALDLAMIMDAGDLMGVRTVDFNPLMNQETIAVTCPFRIE